MKNVPNGLFLTNIIYFGFLSGCGGWIRTSDLEVMSLASYQAAPPRVILHAF